MALLKKLDRLIIYEIFALTVVIVAAVSSVMFLFRLFGFAELLFLSQDGFFITLMTILVYSLPSIFKITLPTSLLLASVIVTVRMAQDRELEAWMASGVSIARMAISPLALGLFMSGLAMGSSLFLEPYARQQYRLFKWMNTRRAIESLLESRLTEKTFISELFSVGDADMALYLNSLDRSRKSFGGVFLSVGQKDGGASSVLVAEKGSLLKEQRRGFSDFILTFEKGRFYQPRTSAFKLFDLAQTSPERFVLAPGLKIESLISSMDPSAKREGDALAPQFPSALEWDILEFKELKVSLISLFEKQFTVERFDSDDIRSSYPREFMRELKKKRASPDWGTNRKLARDHTFFYEQIVLPLSCALLPTLGLCLGVQDPRKKAGIAYLGIAVIIFSFYMLVMLCQQLAQQYVIPPEVTLIAPPLFLVFCTALLLHWRTQHPPSTGFVEYIRYSIRAFRKKFFFSKGNIEK
jgi:lipopolysaccharide export LptBFGC system permease protein LptF